MTASHMSYYTQPRHETLTAFRIPFFSSNSRVGGFISEGIACKPRSVSPPRTGIPSRAKIRRIAPNLLPVPGCLPAPCRDLNKKEKKRPAQPSQSAPTKARTHGCEKMLSVTRSRERQKRSGEASGNLFAHRRRGCGNGKGRCSSPYYVGTKGTSAGRLGAQGTLRFSGLWVYVCKVLVA